jgi:hypothetical protein
MAAQSRLCVRSSEQQQVVMASASISKSRSLNEDILQTLIGQGILSEAQAEVARRDSKNMSMDIEEVLVARKWVSEDVLSGLKNHETEQSDASRSDGTRTSAALSDTHGSSDDYGFNLSRYRTWMREILD